MNFRNLSTFLSAMVLSLSIHADEGMWLPSLLTKVNINEMHHLGATITAEDIYNVNTASFKDAVMALDHGSCTGELISPDGLFLTNHHCGFGEIQEHSTEEHNYLRDGFWAKSHEEELPNIGKTVSFLISVEDVTDRVLSSINDSMSETDRNDTIISHIVKIERQARDSSHYEVEVESLYESNKYFLFIYETFKDVRLVGAPPRFIGKFGGDTDNWMWPRHTGDFSIFRIYTGPDGKPAEYSEENIPMKSKYFFPISLKGYDKDDFSMVMGFPGSTNRYLTSQGVKAVMENTNDTRIKVRAEKLRIIRDYMASSEKATLQYASKYAQSSNYYKYSIGQNRGLERLKVVDKKVKLEKDFTQWMNADSTRIQKYDRALPLIKEAYDDHGDGRAFQFVAESFLRGPEIFLFAYKFRALAKESKKSIKGEMNDYAIEKLNERVKEQYNNYDIETDIKIIASLTEVFVKEVPEKYYPKFISTINRKYKGDYTAWAKSVLTNSIFSTQEDIESFLANPKPKKLQKDAVFDVASQVFDMYGKLNNKLSDKRKKLNEGYRLYYAGLSEMTPNAKYYPDANSTLRITYGEVGDYSPGDAIKYNYYTTIDGYLEKEIPGDREFDVWPEFKDLIYAGDFGDYLDMDGKLHTCFTTNNDITGGNSGSPVLNGKGELIGIAFDGNWEAMSGDIAFEPELQKCINVDIRFVLWIIDKFAGAQNLINEMTIIK